MKSELENPWPLDELELLLRAPSAGLRAVFVHQRATTITDRSRNRYWHDAADPNPRATARHADGVAVR